MPFTMNLVGQVNQMRLPKSKALWPLFETIVNSIQSLEDTIGCEKPTITILANRIEYAQLNTAGEEELNHFEEFVISDNGAGFTTRNYKSFLEAYSTLKIKKGCKGIGRFLWLKAFSCVKVKSIYVEEGNWYKREFTFTLEDEVDPTENVMLVDAPDSGMPITEVTLSGFQAQYRDEVALSLESLAKKIIEHCLPYFIMDGCPDIHLRDNVGNSFNLNSYYKDTYQDSLHRDDITINGKRFSVYHMMVEEGADKHELHLCANNREVKSYDLSKEIPNLEKKISTGESSYYYVGYMTGAYLDESVNVDRYEFNFTDSPLLDTVTEKELTGAALEYIRIYLGTDLDRIKEAKKKAN